MLKNNLLIVIGHVFSAFKASGLLTECNTNTPCKISHPQQPINSIHIHFLPEHQNPAYPLLYEGLPQIAAGLHPIPGGQTAAQRPQRLQEKGSCRTDLVSGCQEMAMVFGVPYSCKKLHSRTQIPQARQFAA